MPGFYNAPAGDDEQARNRIAMALMNIGNPPPRTQQAQMPQMPVPQAVPMQQPQMPQQGMPPQGAPMPQMAPQPMMQGMGVSPPAGAGAPPQQQLGGAGQARPRY